jgi:citrate synthase
MQEEWTCTALAPTLAAGADPIEREGETMPSERYLTAHEAATTLGVSLDTLYAYVSRGQIRSEPGEGTSRSRRYHREDVDRLRERKEQRREPARAAAAALSWGLPVLDSAITLIADDRLYYRGRDVLALATEATIEQVATLLWTGDPDAAGDLFGATAGVAPTNDDLLGLPRTLSPIETFQVLLPLAATRDPAAYDRRPAAVARTGARIMRLLVHDMTGESPDDGLARAIQRGWVPSEPGAAALLNAALILCADHELSVATLAARCAAATGATPYAAVSAGLAAASGPGNIGHCARVEALLDEAGDPESARATLLGRLQRGEQMPGFDHHIYRAGDPRGALLLQLVEAAYPAAPTVILIRALAAAAGELLGDHPTIEFGLVALARVLDLPAGAAPALFSLGRVAGWIAHAIEQYGGGPIRPRARYVGIPPSS